MQRLVFEASESHTLGVEIEVALVDAQNMALKSSIEPILSSLSDDVRRQVKPELMQCYLEVNTGICQTAEQAESELRQILSTVQAAGREQEVELYWSGTHPFSLWQQQQPTADDRYASLLDRLKDMGRQLVTFGLHVHVGVDSGDKAVMICDRIMPYLPVLLAASANSPWWNNRVTGLRSHRSKIMESLPTAGLPSMMRNWSEYVWLVNHLVDTGFINSIRDIWWDVRPHHNFGTVEVRVCDVPGNLSDTMAIVALIHALVYQLSKEIDQGTYQHDYHPMMIRQNKWRAARYGLDAELIDSSTYEPKKVRRILSKLVNDLGEAAEELGCTAQLARLKTFCEGPSWADRQLALLKETGDPREVVRRMLKRSDLTTVAK